MNNLLETIQKNRQQTLAAGATPAVTDQTQTVAGLLRAKSGKAGTAPAIGMSNLAEQSAAQDTANQFKQLQTQDQIQAEAERVQAEGTEQGVRQQREAIDQARKFDTASTRLKTNEIMNELAMDRGSLDHDKDLARLEQAAFLLSMQDKQYTDQLQDIGARRRLDNELEFKNAMAEMAFKDSLDLLKQKLNNNDVLSASDRDYKKALSDLDIADAIAVAEIEARYRQSGSDQALDIMKDQFKRNMKQQQLSSIYQGVGSLGSAGTSAFAAKMDEPAPKKTPTSTKKYNQSTLDSIATRNRAES